MTDFLPTTNEAPRARKAGTNKGLSRAPPALLRKPRAEVRTPGRNAGNDSGGENKYQTTMENHKRAGGNEKSR
jgi:hypothetical protein